MGVFIEPENRCNSRGPHGGYCSRQKNHFEECRAYLDHDITKRLLGSWDLSEARDNEQEICTTCAHLAKCGVNHPCEQCRKKTACTCKTMAEYFSQMPLCRKCKAPERCRDVQRVDGYVMRCMQEVGHKGLHYNNDYNKVWRHDMPTDGYDSTYYSRTTRTYAQESTVKAYKTASLVKTLKNFLKRVEKFEKEAAEHNTDSTQKLHKAVGKALEKGEYTYNGKTVKTEDRPYETIAQNIAYELSLGHRQVNVYQADKDKAIGMLIKAEAFAGDSVELTDNEFAEFAKFERLLND